MCIGKRGLSGDLGVDLGSADKASSTPHGVSGGSGFSGGRYLQLPRGCLVLCQADPKGHLVRVVTKFGRISIAGDKRPQRGIFCAVDVRPLRYESRLRSRMSGRQASCGDASVAMR
jgi:hypothetical protein